MHRTQTRGLKIDIFLPKTDVRYRAVITSIHHYRAAARQMFAACFAAQTAGAVIKSDGDDICLSSRTDRSKKILAEMFGGDGKAPLYAMRLWVLDTLAPKTPEGERAWNSFVWDSLRREVWTRWTANDPSVKKPTPRGWLAMQGAASFAQFRGTGISFPQATAYPKITNHTATLTWDKRLGPVEFQIPSIDGGRWYLWKKLVAGTWDLGSIQLNEKDGKLSLLVSYSMPIARKALDQARILNVTFSTDPEKFIQISGPGQLQADSMSAVGVSEWLTNLRAQRIKIERTRASFGDSKRPWGSRRRVEAINDRLHLVTERRSNGTKDINHKWAQRIVARAKTFDCGRIVVQGIPEFVRGHEWPWSQFKATLKYKAEAAGCSLTIE